MGQYEGREYRRFALSWEETWDENKGISDLIAKMDEEEQMEEVKELVIGFWGESYEYNSQAILDYIAEHKDRFQNLESLFVGDIEQEELEVSWINQGNFAGVLKALPNLKKLTIKGSEGLVLSLICHENLESIEVITGGLPVTVIRDLRDSKLPNLKKLILYLGVEDYGFNGGIEDVKELLSKERFPNLSHLGIVDSEIQDEVVEAILESDLLPQLKVVECSMGCLTDKGGQAILDGKERIGHLEKLDLHYHYLSDEMMKKLEQLPITVDLSEAEEADEYDGEIYMYPMLTE